MKTARWILLSAAAVVVAAGQQPADRIVVERDVRVIVGGAAGAVRAGGGVAGGFAVQEPEPAMGASFAWVGGGMGEGMGDVKGAPFTAEFVTETTQTLADGNRIRHSSKSVFARDGEGRTRRETTLGGAGNQPEGLALTTIFLNDPVGRVHYVLHSQTKTAHKVPMPPAPKEPAMAAGARRMEARTGEGSAVVFEQRVEGPAGPGGPVFLPRMGAGRAAGIVAGRPGAAAPGGMRAPWSGNMAVEPMGKQIIEGVEAEGTRTRMTIPEGQAGNERPIVVESESWYAAELQTVVLSVHRDPRMGETVYRVSWLKKGEPDRQLFEVPADYQVIEDSAGGPGRMIQRFEEKR